MQDRESSQHTSVKAKCPKDKFTFIIIPSQNITLHTELVGVGSLPGRVGGHAGVLPTVHYVRPVDHQLCAAQTNVKVPVLQDVQLLSVFVPKDDGRRDATGRTLNGDGTVHNDLVVVGHAASVDFGWNCNNYYLSFKLSILSRMRNDLSEDCVHKI